MSPADRRALAEVLLEWARRHPSPKRPLVVLDDPRPYSAIDLALSASGDAERRWRGAERLFTIPAMTHGWDQVLEGFTISGRPG
jgi:hypothetical protein